MRRCGCALLRQVFRGLLLASWAIPQAPTHSRRPMATTTSAAAGGGVASGTESASPSSSSSVTATTTAAPAVDAAAATYAPYSSTDMPASVAAASNTPSNTPASRASLAAMTDRLREALRALSEVEKTKAELAKKAAAATATSDHNLSRSFGEGCVAASTVAKSHTPSASGSLASISETSRVEELTPSDSGSSGSNRPCNDIGATGNMDVTSSLNANITTSSSWIRNKKPKFWALVNEAGTDDVEAGGNGERLVTPTTAVTAANSAAAAPSSMATAPSTCMTASASLTDVSSTLVREGSPSVKGPSRPPTSAEPMTTASDVETGSSPPSSADAGAREDAAASSSLKSTGRTATAHSFRIATSVSPFRNRYKRDVARVLSELLDSDPTLGPKLLGQLSAESRRLLLIMGATSEYFGADYEEVAEQVKVADTDRDNSISSKEYDAWARRMADSTPAKRRHAKNSQASADTLDPVLPLTTPAFAQGAAAAGTTAPPPAPSTEPPISSSSSSHGAKGANPVVQASSAPSTRAHPPAAAPATLPCQTADMAVGSTKATSACTMGAMQKSAPSPAASTPESCGVARGSAVAGCSFVSAAKPSPIRASAESSATNSSHDCTSDVAGGGVGASSSLSGSSAATISNATSASIKQDPGYIPWPTYLRIVAAAAPPFLAFGMLDNSTLVLAGGAIDNALSGSLGLSQMAAASLGGVVSGVAGIQVHGLAERYTRATPPQLTMEQQRSDSYSRATQVGNTVGMVVGLILGMTPLLFMSGSTQLAEQEERDRHHFQQEAARSHQRHCKAMEKEEATLRQRLWEEERGTREALLRGDDEL
ncbi:hypothetical protein, conserved [Leishmania tarentolae]|uniref:EF-hand domain-containing protein n=1 Tax=Leishmania tarentolae TaxID=5689 RepID=A0A640KA89_LEITA|nr:hypothetical protein, conserved [Leishmania tarentolae]